jgi:glutathione S-transferase
VDHTGGALPDPGIVAVPYVQINGVYISQTMAIMEALGDELGYLPPQKVQAKARQCLLNIYDIADQGFVKRKEIKTKAQAAEFVNSRVKQFFVAIEAGYKEFAGSLFYGENPCMVDFQLVSCIIGFKSIFGDAVVQEMLEGTAPSALNACNLVLARPNMKAFVEGGYNGCPIFAAHMGVDAATLTD